jgi:hypothetical protein
VDLRLSFDASGQPEGLRKALVLARFKLLEDLVKITGHKEMAWVETG